MGRQEDGWSDGEELNNSRKVGGRMGGVMGKILVVQVRLAVWVGEMQLGGRKGGVMRIISAVRVRVVVWVFEV